MQHYKQYSFTHVPCSCTAETEINLLKLNETLKKKLKKILMHIKVVKICNWNDKIKLHQQMKPKKQSFTLYPQNNFDVQ